MDVKTKIKIKRKELAENGIFRKKTMVEKYGLKIVTGLIFLGIVIGMTGTYCFLTIKYDFKDVFNSRVVIFNNTSVALASTQGGGNAGSSQAIEKVASQEVRGAEQSAPAIQTIKRVAQEEGFDWKLLVAITEQESGRCRNLTGDNGLSKGCFHIYHINTCEYKQTERCINDLDRLDPAKAAKWTIARLRAHESLGYTEMIRSHNGLPADHSNDWYPKNIISIMQGL